MGFWAAPAGIIPVDAPGEAALPCFGDTQPILALLLAGRFTLLQNDDKTHNLITKHKVWSTLSRCQVLAAGMNLTSI